MGFTLEFDFKQDLHTATTEKNGTLLHDSIGKPPPEGNPAAGDTTGNPDFGRRRESSLRRHFQNPDVTSNDLNVNFWEFIKQGTTAWGNTAPDINKLTLQGSDKHPGTFGPLCPNLTGIVDDPTLPQKTPVSTDEVPTGSKNMPNRNSMADTAARDGQALNSRNPAFTSKAQAEGMQWLRRFSRWDDS